MSSTASINTKTPIAAWRWGVVWLLFLATMLAYTDRLALNNTQRYLLAEFEPDPSQRNAVYANIQFAFGISFGLFQILAGFLIDRFSLRWLYLGAIALWSAAGVVTGFVPAGLIGGMIACRVILGIGEAFNWPCAVSCVRRVIPRESRGLANGIFHSGASIGAMATPFLVLLFVDRETGEGWRSLFVVVGCIGFLWVVLWTLCTVGERGKEIDTLTTADPGGASGAESSDGHTPTSFLSVFRMKLFWICLGTGVCVNVCWHFYNQWFPRYLTEDLRVSARDEQLVLAGFFIAADFGSMLSGWVTRLLARRGYTIERSRQLVMTGLALIVVAATVPAAYSSEQSLELKYALFFLVASGSMGGFAIFFSLAQDIIPQHTAKILGTCGCISWLLISGVTKIAGSLAGPGKYAELFVAVGCVPVIAAVVGWFWPQPAKSS